MTGDGTLPVPSPAPSPIPMPRPSFAAALAAWLEIGLLSFGGPTAQIAVMHRVLVDRHGWMDDAAFLRGLNFCLLLPGPEAHQLVTWLGYKQFGFRGGLAAGLLFVLPGAVVMAALSLAYAAWQSTPVVVSLMFGLKAAVIALVALALRRLALKILHHPALVVLAVVAFAAMWWGLPYPLVMLLAAAVGLAVPVTAAAASEHAATPTDSAGAGAAPTGGSGLARFCGVLVAGLVIWWAPVVLAAAVLGPDHILVDEGCFFGKLAVLSFGGAYAVLSWLQQAAVTEMGWLTTAEMADGLGLAETTPGPLILVTQFAGTLAAWKQPAPFSPFVAGLLGGAMTVWTTFAPSFLWIFLAGPAIDRIRPTSLVSRALNGVSAAVVGVIAVLATQLARQTIFPVADVSRPWGVFPLSAGVDADIRAVILAMGVWFALRRFPNHMGWVLAGAVAAGAVILSATARP